MLTEIKMPPARRYATNTEWEPLRFFSDCLFKSSRFDLSLGYFSSSAIRLLSCGFASFLYRGGVVRMTINNVLLPQDIHALEAARSGDFNNKVLDLTDLIQLRNSLSDETKHFFECLSWLIAHDRINIVITKPRAGYGISHTKTGLFYDADNNIIAFDGSCNFTQTALLDNIESVAVFCSWEAQMDARIASYRDDFLSVYNRKNNKLIYIDKVEEVEQAIRTNFPEKGIQELLKDEQKLLHKLAIGCSKINKVKRRIIEEAERLLKKELVKYQARRNEPRFPFPKPRKYQEKACDNWVKNDQRGMFAMATGTGKTITALNCLLNLYNAYHYYKAIIIVPTINLVEQWESECVSFNFTSIIKVYSKSDWEEAVTNISIREKILPIESVSYIIITTYASYSRPKVFNELNKLSRKALFIADEAHNMGYPQVLAKLNSIRQSRRIGLSATPDRQFDGEGNKQINEFFNVTEKYTFEYSMHEAIANGVLCKYFYYPHLVYLTEDEMEEYTRLSKQIAQYYNAAKETLTRSQVLEALLLKRKRIIHKARNKKEVFFQIIRERYIEYNNLKYTLVYVPEGNDSSEEDYWEVNDMGRYNLKEDTESLSLIDQYSKIIKDLSPSISVAQYTSSTENKEHILTSFEKGTLDVITSMRCLDEGVDIPRAELAIFCASTGNPRQFIQRRGRILRKHKDKEYAYIHDLVVIPKITSNSSTYQLEKNLLKSEIQRVKNFASLSENTSESILVLDDILSHYNLSLI